MKVINFNRAYAFAHDGIRVVTYGPGPVEFETADPLLIKAVEDDKAGVVVDPDAEAKASAEAEALAKAEAGAPHTSRRHK
jgi:NAD(P)-dependent dehydrogenase (short-subunit alcohol dehydrogenase family)